MRTIAHFVPMQAPMDQSTVSVTTADGEISAAKSRKYLLLYNAGANNIFVTVDGGTASATDGIKIAPGSALEFDKVVPNGQIRGLASTATTGLILVEAV